MQLKSLSISSTIMSYTQALGTIWRNDPQRTDVFWQSGQKKDTRFDSDDFIWLIFAIRNVLRK